METVTVSVITYNSSKFVLETLESVKAQTYPDLILHICDDCSTDNTVELCRDWIDKNKSRFRDTAVIVPEHNTGVSANCNRAWDACTTKFQKEIAGDDILLPNCIADNMAYVQSHPEMVLVFSRMKSFGASQERCFNSDNNVYKYDLFSWAAVDQYHFLYNERNCIPAPTSFWNIAKVRDIGLRHDERIPMQEDVALWLNALKLGIKFHFFDKLTVRYRIHEGSLSTATLLPFMTHESNGLFWFYYHFVEEYKKCPDVAIKAAVERQMAFYKLYYNEVKSVRMSRRYQVLTRLLKPIDWLRSIF